VLPQAAVKSMRMAKDIKRKPDRFFTKFLSYSLLYDNDSQFQLYRNMME
jgi:hypothetical protein